MKENGQLHQIKKKWEMTKPDCSPLRQKAQCSKIQKKSALSKRLLVFLAKINIVRKMSKKNIPMMPKEAFKK